MAQERNKSSKHYWKLEGRRLTRESGGKGLVFNQDEWESFHAIPSNWEILSRDSSGPWTSNSMSPHLVMMICAIHKRLLEQTPCHPLHDAVQPAISALSTQPSSVTTSGGGGWSGDRARSLLQNSDQTFSKRQPNRQRAKPPSCNLTSNNRFFHQREKGKQQGGGEAKNRLHRGVAFMCSLCPVVPWKLCRGLWDHRRWRFLDMQGLLVSRNVMS